MITEFKQYFDNLDTKDSDNCYKIYDLVYELIDSKYLSESMSWSLPYIKYKKRGFCFFYKKRDDLFFAFVWGSRLADYAGELVGKHMSHIRYLPIIDFNNQKDILTEYILESVRIADER